VTLFSASVLAVLGYGAWWWVKLPMRTAQHWLILARIGRWNALFNDGEIAEFVRHYDDYSQFWFAFRELDPDDRTFSDVVLARQSFKLIRHGDAGDSWPSNTLSVERGTVVVARLYLAGRSFAPVTQPTNQRFFGQRRDY
jgi:hypothetical protein